MSCIYHVGAIKRHATAGSLILGLYGPSRFLKWYHRPRLVGNALGGSPIKRTQVVVVVRRGRLTYRLRGGIRVFDIVGHESCQSIKWRILESSTRNRDMCRRRFTSGWFCQKYKVYKSISLCI